MKQCHHCGTELPDQARFCLNCGAPQFQSLDGDTAAMFDWSSPLLPQLHRYFGAALRRRLAEEQPGTLPEPFLERLKTSGFQRTLDRRFSQLAEEMEAVFDRAGSSRLGDLINRFFDPLLDFFFIHHCPDLLLIPLPEAILRYGPEKPAEPDLYRVVLDYLDLNSEQEEVYLYAQFLAMPEEKLRNAGKSFLFPAREERIFLICDQSLFGSLKEGFAFTDRALYWKGLLQKPRKVVFTELKEIKKEKDWLMINEIFFNANPSLNVKIMKLLRRLKQWYALIFLPLMFIWPQRPAAQSFSAFFPPLQVGGQTLEMGAAGGLNNPQVSEADLNGDGIADLYVFERSGNVHLAFLREGDRYRYAPEYTLNFPPLSDWVLLRDFNADGIADIFAYSDVPGISGVAVFTGFRQEGKLAFRRLAFNNPYQLIFIPQPGGATTQLYISSIDLPAIDDVDCDGDLDILTFNLAGGYVEFYQNRSLELGHGRDSLIFRLADPCWGGFYESGITAAVDLSPALGQCATAFGPEAPVELRHVGSTLLTLDADGDGDRELILGDLSFSNLNFLHNAGSCQRAWMNRQEVNYPANSRAVDLDFFPAAFLADVNGDGRRDLLAAPNALQEGENQQVLWWYQNTGSGMQDRFEFRQSNFLVGEMLDLGYGASPALADLTGDGLLDLLVGNGYRYTGPGERDSRLFFFRNTGTLRQPRFELVDDDFLGLSRYTPQHFFWTPALGDLDGDGDIDLLVGEEGGQLFFAENTAGPGQAAVFASWQFPFAGIDIGQASAPAIADINGDGRADLLIGERNGNINFFPNLSAGGAPTFESDPGRAPNQFFFGRIDTRMLGSVLGHSAPLVFESTGKRWLLTGTEEGQLELYGEIGDNFSGPLPLVDESWAGLKAGFRSRPALADIDGDQLLELVVGHSRGGLQFFNTPLPAEETVSLRPEPELESGWQVYPNPAQGSVVRLSKTANILPDRRTVSLFDAAGRRLLSRIWEGEEMELNIQGWVSGVYWIVLETQKGAARKRLVLVRP